VGCKFMLLPLSCCRTRRVWKPNAQNASLYSEILDKKIRFKVTPAALRLDELRVLATTTCVSYFCFGCPANFESSDKIKYFTTLYPFDCEHAGI